MKVTYENLRPFIRCVGICRRLNQLKLHRAYDNRMICVLSGSCVLETEAKTEHAGAGDVFVIPPGEAYRVVYCGEQKIIVVNFDWTDSFPERTEIIPSVEEKYFNADIETEAPDFSSIFGCNGIVRLHASENICEMIQKLLDLYLNSHYTADILKALLCGQFMIIIGMLVSHSYDSSKKRNRTAEEIYEYVCGHCTEHVTLKTVSEHFHYHISYINRVLNDSCGMSFRQLVIQKRLTKSLSLMENSEMTLEEVAEQVGFYSRRHFSQAFKNKFGQPPSAYFR